MRLIVIILLIPFVVFGQESTAYAEIVSLEEEKCYKYIKYYENGEKQLEVGFFAKKPYSSTAEFERKLNSYKIKEHGPSLEYYRNGQLKEIVVYKKGKVVEYAKNYFEDGEEYSVGNIELPVFQFDRLEYQAWFSKQIYRTEQDLGVDLSGSAFVALEISKTGEVKKTIIAKSSNTENDQYLLAIADQIKVVEPATKVGKPIGTRYGFRVVF